MSKDAQTQIQQIGFPEAFHDLRIATILNRREFDIPVIKNINNDKALFNLHFGRSREDDSLQLISYEARWLKSIAVTHATIDGINTAELERSMTQIDWNSQKFTQSHQFSQGKYNALKQAASSIQKKLYHLETTGEKGRMISEAMQVKYLYGTHYGNMYAGQQRLELQADAFYPKKTFSGPDNLPNPEQAFKQVKREAVKKNTDQQLIPVKTLDRIRTILPDTRSGHRI